MNDKLELPIFYAANYSQRYLYWEVMSVTPDKEIIIRIREFRDGYFVREVYMPLESVMFNMRLEVQR